MEENLEALRAQLDGLDDALLDLLVRRARLCRRVGELKRRSGRPVHRPEREAEILARLSKRLKAQTGPAGAGGAGGIGETGETGGSLSPAQLERIYRAVFAVSKQLQENE